MALQAGVMEHSQHQCVQKQHQELAWGADSRLHSDTRALGHTVTVLLRAGGSWCFLSILTYKKFFPTERSQCACSLLLQ